MCTPNTARQEYKDVEIERVVPHKTDQLVESISLVTERGEGDVAKTISFLDCLARPSLGVKRDKSAFEFFGRSHEMGSDDGGESWCISLHHSDVRTVEFCNFPRTHVIHLIIAEADGGEDNLAANPQVFEDGENRAGPFLNLVCPNLFCLLRKLKVRNEDFGRVFLAGRCLKQGRNRNL